MTGTYSCGYYMFQVITCQIFHKIVDRHCKLPYTANVMAVELFWTLIISVTIITSLLCESEYRSGCLQFKSVVKI